MHTVDYQTTPDLNEIMREVRRLDLSDNVSELDTYGFTVVEPDRVAPPEFQRHALEAVLRQHERHTGQWIDDIDTAELPLGAAAYNGLLFEDSVFEQMLLNPVVLALARYLNGRSVVLSNFTTVLKSPQIEAPMPLHTDSDGVPPPLPDYAQVCNVTWIHSEYSLADGSVAIVPGSHRYGRQPNSYEEDGYRDDSPVKPIAIDAPAGSLICWHGNTWHGSFPRRNPGLRVNTIMYFCRSYYRQMVDFPSRVPADSIERNPPEFAQVLGFGHPWPLLEDGRPRNESRVRRLGNGTSQWD